MIPTRQEDDFGCAVACVAFVLQIPYQEALTLFKDGKRRVYGEANFYCPEIVKILKRRGLHFAWEKLKKVNQMDFKENSIVFIKPSNTHLYGHFLCINNGQWMDPWINLPEKPIKGGFRSFLPGDPTYQVFPEY